MIRTSLNILIGVFLSGCTVNNFHAGAFSSSDDFSTSNTIVSSTRTWESREAAPAAVPAAPQVVGNLYIRPECGPYQPLPVPKPAQVNMTELAAAESSREINAITLRNVKELHAQIKEYAARQQKDYADYVGRCVVKK